MASFLLEEAEKIIERPRTRRSMSSRIWRTTSTSLPAGSVRSSPDTACPGTRTRVPQPIVTMGRRRGVPSGRSAFVALHWRCRCPFLSSLERPQDSRFRPVPSRRNGRRRDRSKFTGEGRRHLGSTACVHAQKRTSGRSVMGPPSTAASGRNDVSPQRHVDQGNEYRYLDEGAERRRPVLRHSSAKDADAHGDRQFEVVASGGEGEGGGSIVGKPDERPSANDPKPHDGEVTKQWAGLCERRRSARGDRVPLQRKRITMV